MQLQACALLDCGATQMMERRTDYWVGWQPAGVRIPCRRLPASAVAANSSSRRRRRPRPPCIRATWGQACIAQLHVLGTGLGREALALLCDPIIQFSRDQ
jgi:hypothetical protein